MIKKLTKVTSIFIFTLLTFSIAFEPVRVSALTGAEFKADNIIDDAIFFNDSSMSVSQIQSFLDAKVPTCRSGYTCLKDYRQDTQSRPAEDKLCKEYVGGNKRASQIIYDVSKACGVNPQVMLVVLQKEQSLVTDTWPEDIQYRSATGFGCPDTAPCDSDYYGFFNQVYHGARIYKKYARDASMYNYKAGRNNNILFNPNSACGSSSVFLQNQATAGLYIYTPYQPNKAALDNLYGTGDNCSAYGNRNFWRMFNDWFGSTRGSLIRTSTSSDLFYSDGQRKFIIPSMELAAQYGLGLNDVRFVTQGDMDAIPMAASPFSDRLGSVVKSNDDADADGGALYLVDDRNRIPFASMEQFTNYGYSSSSITYLPLATIQRLSLSGKNLSNFTQAPDLSVTKIETGKKRAIFELSKLGELNPSGDITRLTNFTLASFIHSAPLVDGDYLVVGPDSGLRIYNGASYLGVPSMNVYGCWGLKGVKTFKISSYAISNGTSSGSLRCAGIDSTNNTYIVDQGTKYSITNSPLLTPSAAGDALLNRLPTGTLKPVLKGPGPELTVLENGLVRPIMSLEALTTLGHDFSDIQTLGVSTYNIIPRGAKKLTPGSLLLEPTGAVSVASSYTTRLQVTSVQQFESYGFDWKKLVKADAKDLEAYPTTGNLGHYALTGADLYLIDGRVRYFIPTTLDADLGIDRTTFTAQDFETVNKSTLPWTMTQFIKADNDNAIYKIVSGKKSPLASWEAFERESGNRPQDLVILKPIAVNRFPTGPIIY